MRVCHQPLATSHGQRQRHARTPKAGAPKELEWYLAFSLMVTLIWLYMTLLRLLALLSNRQS